MNLTVGKVLGTTGSGKWGQVHDFLPDELEKLEQRGRLVLAVSFGAEGKREEEMVGMGREVISRVHELYYGNKDGSPFQALGEAVEKAGVEFDPVDLAALVFVGGGVNVSVWGKAGVWVKRDKVSGWLIEPGHSHRKLRSLWGKSEDGMVLVSGNHEFWESLPEGVLKAKMSELETNFNEVVEGIALLERGNSRGTGGVGVVVVSKREEERIAEEDVVARLDRPSIWSRFKFDLPTVQLRGSGVRTKQWVVGAVFVAILLLVVGLGGWKGGEAQRRSEEIKKRTVEAAALYEETRALAVTNPAGISEALSQIKNLLSEIEAFGGQSSEIALIREGLAELEEVAMGSKNVQLSEVVKLSLVREDMKGDLVSLAGRKLGILDKEAGRVGTVDVDKEAVELVSGGGVIGRGMDILGVGKRMMVISDRGIWEVAYGKKEKLLIEDSLSDVVDSGSFLDSVYVLDGSGQIWKFAGGVEGLSKKSSWLVGEVRLIGVANLAIDGNIWVVDGGKVRKFVRGKEVEFVMTGLEKELASGAKVYTNEKVEALYILDKSNKRVVVVKKDGMFVEQWVDERFLEVGDVALDEKGVIFAALGDIIWKVEP